MSPEFKRGGCTACGSCCKAICLDGVAPGTAAEDWQRAGGDKGFIGKNWTEITRDQAFEINPYLKLWDAFHRGNLSFFTCSRFDPATNKCGAYEDRPQVCRGYPHYVPDGNYTRLDPKDPLYSADCGFTIDRVRLSLIDVLAKVRDKRRVEESFIRKAMILRPPELIAQDRLRRQRRIFSTVTDIFGVKAEELGISQSGNRKEPA